MSMFDEPSSLGASERIQSQGHTEDSSRHVLPFQTSPSDCGPLTLEPKQGTGTGVGQAWISCLPQEGPLVLEQLLRKDYSQRRISCPHPHPHYPPMKGKRGADRKVEG